MTGRSPLAQPLTLDFNLVTLRNPARGRELLGVLSSADVSALCNALGVRADALSALITGLNTRISTLESAPAIAPSGGSGLSGSVELDFGANENDLASVDVPEPSAPAGSVAVVNLCASTTDDHDPEDGLIEEVRVSAGEVTAGVGFTVNAFAPFGTWGRYRVNYQIL